jgi:quercetin dioxygenase-like cupin family protein
MPVFLDRDIAPAPLDPATFAGTGRVKRIEAANHPALAVFRVEFEPGARTHWHAHSGVQLLLVTEGRGRVQTWNGPIRELGPGDVVSVVPGEKHWHGAAHDSRFVHIAVNVESKTTWMEPVEGE